jgi:4-hydroxybenzoate polyprenyltransferase
MRSRIAAAAEGLGFARTGNWFVAKIPPLLAVAYLDILRSGIQPQPAARLLGCGLFSIFSVAIYGHVVNDIFDLEADRLANKANRLAAMGPVSRALLAGAFLAAGFLPALMARYTIGVLLLLTLNYLWPTIYSVPITRLKEKDLFGVACDALGSHVTPTLFILALFATATSGGPSDGRSAVALMATVWAGALGLKGILHHQIADRDNDIQSGTATFATKRSVESLQRFLPRFNLLIELPISALFAAIVSSWCPLAVAALAVYIVSEAMKYRLGFQFALSANPATIRASVPFTNEMFYVLWMPIAAATQLAVDHAAFVWLPLLHAAIFREPLVRQIRDWRAIGENATLVYRGSGNRHGP